MRRPAKTAKKKATSKKASKKPAAGRAASKKTGTKAAAVKPQRPARSPAERAEPYTPKPIAGVGWPAFRYPLS